MYRALVNVMVTNLVLLFASHAARGDGMLQQLPPDGSWAKFDLQMQLIKDTGETVQSYDGTMTIRSVGRVTRDGEPCRWLEFDMDVRNPKTGKGSREVYKLLIPEKDAVAGANPFLNVHESWMKLFGGSVRDRRTGEYREVPPHAGKNQDVISMERNLSSRIHGPLESSRKLSGEAIECRAGKFTCPGVNGSRAYVDPRNGRKIHFLYETRFSPDVPFGVVTHRSEDERNVGGKAKGVFRQDFKLAATGKDAKSEIPESN